TYTPRPKIVAPAEAYYLSAAPQRRAPSLNIYSMVSLSLLLWYTYSKIDPQLTLRKHLGIPE
ncbi:MAG TPA: hypothetical protein VIM87_28620, partial [Chitinophaga sp.]|uniref:hypothetical protein n=1 Tax=Chitinophaga sp. TaxID=1869181 RepID=UPI002F93F130